MIEPALAVLAYSPRMIGARSSPTSCPTSFFHDQLVHAQVGLVQPEPPHVRGLKAQRVQVLFDVRCGHRHHFLEDLATLLHEGLVAGVGVGIFAAVHEARVVADVVGILRHELGAQDLPAIC